MGAGSYCIEEDVCHSLTLSHQSRCGILAEGLRITSFVFVSLWSLRFEIYCHQVYLPAADIHVLLRIRLDTRHDVP